MMTIAEMRKTELNKMIDVIVTRYGHEAPESIIFCGLCEHYPAVSGQEIARTYYNMMEGVEA